MSVVIRLDSAALQLLIDHFGEEFALELKGAVLKNALNRHIGLVLEDELKREMERLVKVEIKAQIAEKPWEKFATLTDFLRDRITRTVENEVTDTIRNAVHGIEVQPIVDKAVASFAQAVQHKVYTTMRESVQEWAKQEVERQLALLTEE
jgi:hypothetical protein